MFWTTILRRDGQVRRRTVRGSPSIYKRLILSGKWFCCGRLHLQRLTIFRAHSMAWSGGPKLQYPTVMAKVICWNLTPLRQGISKFSEQGVRMRDGDTRYTKCGFIGNSPANTDHNLR